MRPNIFLGVSDGSAQYKKWYYELMIDQVDHFVTSEPSHLRVGWANAKGYAPYPGGGEGWGGNGVGDDLYSYGFDGLHLWSGQWEEEDSAFVCHSDHILMSYCIKDKWLPWATARLCLERISPLQG